MMMLMRTTLARGALLPAAFTRHAEADLVCVTARQSSGATPIRP